MIVSINSFSALLILLLSSKILKLLQVRQRALNANTFTIYNIVQTIVLGGQLKTIMSVENILHAFWRRRIC